MKLREAQTKAANMAQDEEIIIFIVIDEQLEEYHGRENAYRAVTEEQFDRDQACGEFFTFFDEFEPLRD